MVRLDLYSLQIFVSVATCASLSKAACAVHLTPSAVSKRIAELEARLGVPLLVRHSTGVSLTPAGRIVERHAQEILARAALMSREVSALLSQVQGQIRVMSNTTAILLGLLEDIQQFQAIHPGIQVQVKEGSSPQVVEAVRTDAADIGVCIRLEEMDSLEVRPYRQTQLLVLVPDQHVLAGRTLLGLSDLMSYRMIWTPPASLLVRSSLAKPVRVQHGASEMGLSVRSFDGVLRSVREGAGIAIVPEVVAAAGLPAGVTGIALRLDDGVFEVALSRGIGRGSNPAVDALYSWLGQRSQNC